MFVRVFVFSLLRMLVCVYIRMPSTRETSEVTVCVCELINERDVHKEENVLVNFLVFL